MRLRTFASLKYATPHGFLIALRHMEPTIAAARVDPKVRELRTNMLHTWLERRQAALFCHCMSERIGSSVRFAPIEEQDYDFIATWQEGDTRRYSPVQLKEVVPTRVNANASLQKVVDSLRKYTDSQDLTVAIHLNQVRKFDPTSLNADGCALAGLWIFGAISTEPEMWGLWGDFLAAPQGTRHAYPAA